LLENRLLLEYELLEKNRLLLEEDTLLASDSYRDNTLRVRNNSETGEEVRTLEGHTDWVECLAALPGDILASGSYRDNNVSLWNTKSCKLVRTLKGHTDWVSSLVSLPGNRLASGSNDRTVRIWNLNPALKELLTFIAEKK